MAENLPGVAWLAGSARPQALIYMKHWILIVGAGVAVAGCGMKGPLYLPDKNASVVTRPGSGNTTTTAPPTQTTPGSTASPTPAAGGATPTPGGVTPPPAQPQDKSSDDSQSTGATPPKT